MWLGTETLPLTRALLKAIFQLWEGFVPLTDKWGLQISPGSLGVLKRWRTVRSLLLTIREVDLWKQMDQGRKAQMSHDHEFGGKTLLWEAWLLPRTARRAPGLTSSQSLLTQPCLEMSAAARALLSPLLHPTLQRDQMPVCCGGSYLHAARTNGSSGFKKNSMNYWVALGVLRFFLPEAPRRFCPPS